MLGDRELETSPWISTVDHAGLTIGLDRRVVAKAAKFRFKFCTEIILNKARCMIHEVTGDILMTKAQAFAHGVSPNDHFDSGLALALRERWPAMAKDFRHYVQQTHPKPGELWTWGNVGGLRIYNLLTQEGEHGHGAKSGRATLANVNHCLKRLRHELEKDEIKSLAMPKLATGVGGLEWPDVHTYIVQHLGDLKTTVYLYSTYHKGQQANEPGL